MESHGHTAFTAITAITAFSILRLLRFMTGFTAFTAFLTAFAAFVAFLARFWRFWRFWRCWRFQSVLEPILHPGSSSRQAGPQGGRTQRPAQRRSVPWEGSSVGAAAPECGPDPPLCHGDPFATVELGDAAAPRPVICFL